MNRAERAEQERIVAVMGDSAKMLFVYTGDDDPDQSVHTVQMRGGKAEWCSCPDHYHRGAKCKHMIAVDRDLVDAWRSPKFAPPLCDESVEVKA